jgi:hypothetical protein
MPRLHIAPLRCLNLLASSYLESGMVDRRCGQSSSKPNEIISFDHGTPRDHRTTSLQAFRKFWQNTRDPVTFRTVSAVSDEQSLRMSVTRQCANRDTNSTRANTIARRCFWSLCLSPRAPIRVAGMDDMFALPAFPNKTSVSLVPYVIDNGKPTDYHLPSHFYL